MQLVGARTREGEGRDLVSMLLRIEAAALKVLELITFFEECLAYRCREICRDRLDRDKLALIDELLSRGMYYAAFNICIRHCNLELEEESRLIRICEEHARKLVK
jgi:hypothetical protein